MKYLCFFALASVLFSAGCNRDSVQNIPPQSSLVKEPVPPAKVGTHTHISEGPHHGTLIELGNERYHAELVHDKKSVTIFMLDGSATKAIPIDATEVTINLIHDGKPAQFKLAASPETNDPSGKSSRFTREDEHLVEELEHGHPGLKLSVVIEGKGYSGEIVHDHEDSHEHGHAH